MSHDRDYLLALEMQKKWNEGLSDNDIEEIPDAIPPKKRNSKNNNNKYRSNLDDDYLNRTSNLVHPQWETLDPTPDTQALFTAFDDKFFQKKLRCVTLEWSKRMYSCAGICYSRRNGLGMAVTIRLSEPLLKLRSRKDLVETMLHEMIHAYCFVLGIREGNGGHGPNFKKMMNAINLVAGTNITVYHTFHDEVNNYKTHWWRCNGLCQHRAPFFGYVKRTSNRAPGPNDIWWSQHHHSCGGTFMKIKEPEKRVKKSKSSKSIDASEVKPTGGDIRKFFPTSGTAGRPRGPVKTNGGGTLLLNPKTRIVPPIEVPRPVEAPRATKLPGGNLTNVIGFKDLGEDGTPRSTNSTRDFSMTGTGYSLTNTTSTPTVPKEVDRNHLRNVWLKRFGNTADESQNKPDEDEPTNHLAGNAKRRRLSVESDDSEVTFVGSQKKPHWVAIDDDIMVDDVQPHVIAVSSSEDDGDPEESRRPNRDRSKAMVFADADARQTQIKKEILDESNDLSDAVEDDIVLIDDEYNDDDDVVNTSMELADTSLVDDLFGEDTLLKEFKRENAVAPSCSRYSNDPRNDITTCPICQEKMKREDFSDHLDGCVGISQKIAFPKYGKSKPKTSKPKNTSPRNRKRAAPSSQTREILLSAGYTEEDIDGLPGVSDATTSPSDDDLNISDRQRRTMGLYTPTRPCPACCQEVEVDQINEHLDECLSK